MMRKPHRLFFFFFSFFPLQYSDLGFGFFCGDLVGFLVGGEEGYFFFENICWTAQGLDFILLLRDCFPEVLE